MTHVLLQHRRCQEILLLDVVCDAWSACNRSRYCDPHNLRAFWGFEAPVANGSHCQWPFQDPKMEYPHKIWPYMVQYLQLRILEFPLTLGPFFLGWPNLSHSDPHCDSETCITWAISRTGVCILLKQWLENRVPKKIQKVIPYHISLTESVPNDES